MSHRLIKFTCSEDDADVLETMLEGLPVVAVWTTPTTNACTMADVLVHSNASEPVVDRLREQLSPVENFRLAILPVEAYLPRAAKPPFMAPRARLSREELRTDVEDVSGLSWTFLLMVVLSAIVAAVGLLRDDVAVIIGAMVIAPLLGSNLGLSLATTLGDLKLGLRSAASGALGGLIAVGMAALFVIVWEVDPLRHSVLARTVVGYDDVLLALAAGSACALSVTAGTSSALIGVMVAVALLPPTVTVGMLAGAGHWSLAGHAATLLAVNLICVNLAGVTTFLLYGIRPYGWWEQGKALRSSLTAVTVWTVLLAALIALLYVTG